MSERYFLWTVGCQMNVADSEKLAAGFTRLGMEAVPEADGADIVVVNTCSVRQHAEDRAYSLLGRVRLVKEERPDLKVAVMGCMVGLRTTELEKRFPFVDVFARPQQFEPIMALVEEPAEDLGGEFWPSTFAVPEGPTHRLRPRRARLRQVLHLLHRSLPPRPRAQPPRRRDRA